MPLDREVEFLAVDEIQLCADPERGHVFTDRLLHARGLSETMFLGAATMAPLIRRLLPGRRDPVPRALLDADLRRAEEAHPPAAPQRRRRLLGRRGLRHRRADPPPARRRGGGDGLAVAPHPQRPGRAVPVRRGRLPGRHRRDRHGPQHGRRPCRLRRPAQVRRPAHPLALCRRRSARSPAAPAASAATAPSASPATPPRSTPTWSRRSRATLRPASQAAEWRNARARFRLARRACMRSLAAPPPTPGLKLVRGGAGRDDAAPACADDPSIAARRDRAQSDARCGRSARRRISARRRWKSTRACIGATSSSTDRRATGACRTTGWPGQFARARPHRRRHRRAVGAPRPRPHPGLCRQPRRLARPTRPHWQGRTRALEDRLSDTLHEPLMQRFVDRRTSALMRVARPARRTMLGGVAADGAVTVEGQWSAG